MDKAVELRLMECLICHCVTVDSAWNDHYRWHNQRDLELISLKAALTGEHEGSSND